MSARPDWMKARGRGGPRPSNHASIGLSANQNAKNKNMGGGKNKLNVTGSETTQSNNISNTSRTFEMAVQSHQKASQKHLQKQHDGMLMSSSSEEEDDDDDEKRRMIIAKIIGAHDDDDEGSSDFKANLAGKGGRLEELIKETMAGKANVCLVCIETVKKTDAIWSCGECHTMIHLPCMQQWINDGSYQSTTPSLSLQHFPNQKQPWFCPKCRCSYERSDFPKVYVCFCGKVENPAFDSWLVPHSCGQTCNKQLKPSCGHHCLLLCHPGPCPPCPKTVRTSCYCGKGQHQMKRCGDSGWSCRHLCGRLLKCLKHHCTRVCHLGECGECSEQSERTCLCGKKTKVQPCADDGWQCQEVCGKHLDCGFHRCAVTCHSGPCSPCSRLCPCGKTRYGEESCRGDVVLCSEVCGKLLLCGQHSCPDLCHTGACAACKELVRKRCRCGRKERQVLCGKECLCDVKCPSLKDCGLHACKRKCCDGSCPPCSLTCGRMLTCRHHKCPNTCHRGPCYPCSLTSTLACKCGTTFVKVPCGAEKRMKPPKCHLPCRTPPDCKHPSRLPHHCHYGSCPRCTQTCGQGRSTCEHPCTATCHHAVEVRVRQDNRNLAGPWEVNKMAERVEVVDLECPPCGVQVAVTCLGGHETTMVACSESKPRSCHRECGRLLSCGNHTCKLECHLVQTAVASGDSIDRRAATATPTKNKNASKNIPSPPSEAASSPPPVPTPCEVCENACDRERPTGCTHSCLLPCHPNACPPCSQLIKMRCHCSMVVMHVGCEEWCGADVKGRDGLMSCSSRCPRLLSCGHPCRLSCHSGQCSKREECVEKVKVKCPCGRRRVDGLCRAVLKGEVEVRCDGACDEMRERLEKEKEKERQLKAEIEEKKKREELEAFDRSVKGGRRRRQRKTSTNHDTDESFLRMHKNKLVLSVLVVVFSAFFYWLTLF